MPYHARSTKSKTYKKGYHKGTSRTVTPYTVAKIAKSVANKSKPTREKRFTFYNLTMKTTAPISNSFLYKTMTLINQGSSDNERLGDKIYMSGVKLNFSCDNPATTSRCLRVLILQNNNRNGDLLDLSTWTDLFTQDDESDRTADGLAGDINAPVNSNYRIFCDKKFTLEPSGAKDIQRSFYCPIQKKVEYNNLGDNTTASSGEIYCIFHLSEFGSATVATESHLFATARVFFKDA